MKLANYQTSRDYEYLAQLMLNNSIVCLINRSVREDVVFDTPAVSIAKFYKYKDNIYKAGNGEVYSVLTWITDCSKEDFIKQCQEYDLEFIVPNE